MSTKKKLLSFIQSFSSSSGFTLLELMVVFSLTTLMAGGGFFAFTQYARSQSFNQGVEQIRLTYEQARNFAIANVKPKDECITDGFGASILKGYRVELESDTLFLITECTSGDTSVLNKLPDGVKLRNIGGGAPTACSGVEFQVITGNVNATSGTLPCTIEVYHENDDNLIRSITIAQDGRISFNEIDP